MYRKIPILRFLIPSLKEAHGSDFQSDMSLKGLWNWAQSLNRSYQGVAFTCEVDHILGRQQTHGPSSFRPSSTRPGQRCSAVVKGLVARREEAVVSRNNVVVRGRSLPGVLMKYLLQCQSIADMEKMVLAYGEAFQLQHFVQAMKGVPTLERPVDNCTARIRNLVNYISMGLVQHQGGLDGHSTAACIHVYGRLLYGPAPALNSLLEHLMRDDAKLLQSCSTKDLAGIAWGLARVRTAHSLDSAVKDALVQDSDQSTPSSPVQPTHCLPRGTGGKPLLSGHKSHAMMPSGPVGTLQGQGEALVPLRPVDRIWVMLEVVSCMKLNDFSAQDVAALAWAFAKVGKSNARLMSKVRKTSLPRWNNFPLESLYQLLYAAARTPYRDMAFISGLCDQAASLKEHKVTELAQMMRHLTDLEFYHAGVCAMVTKITSIRMQHCPPDDKLAIVQCMATLKYHDRSWLLQYMKELYFDIPSFMAPSNLSEALLRLAQLNLTLTDQQHHKWTYPLAQYVVNNIHEFSAVDVVKVLWALVCLNFMDPRIMNPLVRALQRCRGSELTAEAAAMLWDASVMLRHESTRPLEPSQEDILLKKSTAYEEGGCGADNGNDDLMEDDNQGDMMDMESSVMVRDLSRAAREKGGGAQSEVQLVTLLPSSLLEECRESFLKVCEDQKVTCRPISECVLKALLDAGYEAVENLLLKDDALCVDIAADFEGCPVAIMCTGPKGYTRTLPYRPTGATAMKLRQLVAMGWLVVEVPFFEWNPLGGESEQLPFLLSKMLASCVSVQKTVAKKLNSRHRGPTRAGVLGSKFG